MSVFVAGDVYMRPCFVVYFSCRVKFCVVSVLVMRTDIEVYYIF